MSAYKKIVVATDLSDHSISALRFAIQLATQMNAELIFFYAHELGDNTVYHSAEEYANAVRDKNELTMQLNSFVNGVYESMKVLPGESRCVIHFRFGIIFSILDYVSNHNCDYICIGTRGADDIITQYLGTNTGELIKESPVPVFCVPQEYVRAPVTRLLYASDLQDFQNEIKRVIDFGKLVNSEIHMLHFKEESSEDSAITVNPVMIEHKEHRLLIHYKTISGNNRLLDELDFAVMDYQPSVMIMFTDQKRNFFEMLLVGSKSEQYSFRAKVPLLIFGKS